MPRLARSRYEAADHAAVIQDLLSGQYENPIRVGAFNTEERWSEDVSERRGPGTAPTLRSTGGVCPPPSRILLSGMKLTIDAS